MCKLTLVKEESVTRKQKILTHFQDNEYNHRSMQLQQNSMQIAQKIYNLKIKIINEILKCDYQINTSTDKFKDKVMETSQNTEQKDKEMKNQGKDKKSTKSRKSDISLTVLKTTGKQWVRQEEIIKEIIQENFPELTGARSHQTLRLCWLSLHGLSAANPLCSSTY